MSPSPKAIPPSRDRLQSRLLVLTVGSILLVFALWAVSRLIGAFWDFGLPSWAWVMPWIISLTFALLVRAVRAATFGGILFGSLICLAILLGTQFPSLWHSGLPPLTALFLLTFAATRAGRHRKVLLGVAESQRGRNAAQVIANLGIAGLIAITAFFSVFDSLIPVTGFHGWSRNLTPVLLAASLCEATADTVSSEIGQAFGGSPILLTSLRPVSPGTDGAVSGIGTIAGMLSAGFVALIAMASMFMTLRGTVFALLGGIAGLLFDSLLGATLERRGWLGNNLVNFTSTAFAALVALALLLLFG
jgi:uncharacterized protein (TIGR00297 family)